ncbi:hypothetical protein [Pararhodonellum marinum]|uniref:hypothetical protein n=1 Tax=Pararhodonellum marinum TaxID=2755358 RepID=UPI00188F101A|nr:hypothetical protein [Pararhodonellum marinum]
MKNIQSITKLLVTVIILSGLLGSCLSRTTPIDPIDPGLVGIRLNSGESDYQQDDENFAFTVTVSSLIVPSILEIEFEDRSFGAKSIVFTKIFPRNQEGMEFIAGPEANTFIFEYEFPIEEAYRRGTSYDVKAILLDRNNQTFESNVVRISVAS